MFSPEKVCHAVLITFSCDLLPDSTNEGKGVRLYIFGKKEKWRGGGGGGVEFPLP